MFVLGACCHTPCAGAAALPGTHAVPPAVVSTWQLHGPAPLAQQLSLTAAAGIAVAVARIGLPGRPAAAAAVMAHLTTEDLLEPLLHKQRSALPVGQQARPLHRSAAYQVGCSCSVVSRHEQLLGCAPPEVPAAAAAAPAGPPARRHTRLMGDCCCSFWGVRVAMFQQLSWP
jgi:hypothetical protein